MNRAVPAAGGIPRRFGRDGSVLAGSGKGQRSTIDRTGRRRLIGRVLIYAFPATIPVFFLLQGHSRSLAWSLVGWAGFAAVVVATNVIVSARSQRQGLSGIGDLAHGVNANLELSCLPASVRRAALASMGPVMRDGMLSGKVAEPFLPVTLSTEAGRLRMTTSRWAARKLARLEVDLGEVESVTTSSGGTLYGSRLQVRVRHEARPLVFGLHADSELTEALAARIEAEVDLAPAPQSPVGLVLTETARGRRGASRRR